MFQITITIYRGTHQIGGCTTEIRTEQTRIFIDFGTPLPELDGTQPVDDLSIPGLTEGTADCDGVFFTHYHADHIGNIHRILPEIPLYMGEAAQKLSLCLNERLQKAYRFHPEIFSDNSDALQALKRVRNFISGKSMVVGDLTITPYRVDHSAFDACLFLVEAEGIRILHTGDFRTHGYTGDGLSAVLAEIGKVNYLICEGTMLSRGNEMVMTEAELETEARKIMRDNRNVFVLCSSTNIDRIRAFYSAKPRTRPAVCDWYQKTILDEVEALDSTAGKAYQFDWIIPDADWNNKLHNWMADKGFLAFVRANDRFRKMMEPYRGNCKVIYSMWSGYLEKPEIKDFLDGFDWISLHTSGHATRQAIRMMVESVKPDQIIPLHTEVPEAFQELFPDQTVVLLKDKEEYPLNQKRQIC